MAGRPRPRGDGRGWGAGFDQPVGLQRVEMTAHRRLGEAQLLRQGRHGRLAVLGQHLDHAGPRLRGGQHRTANGRHARRGEFHNDSVAEIGPGVIHRGCRGPSGAAASALTPRKALQVQEQRFIASVLAGAVPHCSSTGCLDSRGVSLSQPPEPVESPHPLEPAAVAIRDLVVRYGAFAAVDGLTLTAPRGAITAVLGPNGAGKTTTVETAEGYRTPTSGSVQVLGRHPRQRPGRTAAAGRRDAAGGRGLRRCPGRRSARCRGRAVRPPPARGRAAGPAGADRPGPADRQAALRADRRSGYGSRWPWSADPRWPSSTSPRPGSTRRPAMPPGIWSASSGPPADRWC